MTIDMYSAKFTNVNGVNPFSQVHALLATNKRADRKQRFEQIAKARQLAQKALSPQIQFAKDGSCTAYMVYVE